MHVRRSFFRVFSVAIAASFTGFALWGEPPTRSREGPAPNAAGARPGVVESTANLRSIPIAVAMTPVRPIARVATRGAAAIQAPCQCDLDCAGLDDASGCILGQCIDGECDVRDAPTLTICEDGVNYCTIGRCDGGYRQIHGDGTCVDHATVDPDGDVEADPSLSRCAKECDGGANDGQSCTIEYHCAGGNGCTLKTHRQPSEAGWYVACAEVGSGYDCSLIHNAADVVRCCETADPANIGFKSSAACTTDGGIGMEITDPDDTMHLTGSNPRCPQYSSGIAPDDAGAFDGSAVGPITPPAKMCNNLGLLGVGEYGGPCETAADCHPRCSTGTLQGEICQPARVATDCDTTTNPGATCDADTCVPNTDDCPGIVSLGDDYSFNTKSWIRLQEIRFRGGTGRKDEVISFDIYDDSTPPVRVTSIARRIQESGTATYRFIADCDEGCDYWESLCDVEDLRCEIPDDPPRVIPPRGWLVMRAIRSVPDTEFGLLVYHNYDLNGHWVPTDTVDVGNNDPDKIWVDGAIISGTETEPLPQGQRVLAFELVGVELAEDPTGGCCRPESQGGGCVETFQHECRYCLGPAGTHLGNVCDRSASWGEGTWSAIDRDCPGTFEGCSTNRWHGNRNREDYLVGSAEDCAEACVDGSCCAADGTCTMATSQESCEAGEGTFLGLGTGCSDDTAGPPPGPWEPNCCEQPMVPRDPGGGCCADLYQCAGGEWCNPKDSHSCDAPREGPCALVCPGAEVLELAVPPSMPRGQRTVLDITTDSTGHEPESGYDDCRHGTDPGWFVSWHLDEAAIVTLNLCCNAPVFFPAGPSIPCCICPCDIPECCWQISPNPNRYGYGSGCGNDFCCEDGNLSIEWTLGPGTYHWEPNTGKECEGTADGCQTEAQCAPGVACIDHRGKIQIHIIAQPIPPGVCCLIDETDPAADNCPSSHCEYLTIWDCTVAGGDYLGDGDGWDLCGPDPDPCYLGACCVANGECYDGDPPGSKITCADCKQLDPVYPYHGGLTCEQAPCTVCPFEDAAHGQGASGEYIYTADRNFGIMVADDFTPAESGVIGRVCYNHAYVPPQGGECSDTPADDQLEIRFYEDNFGLPGTELDDSPGAAVEWDSRGGQAGYRTWRYSAPIAPGVLVDFGSCYWISIMGHGRPDCTVHWTESRDGNNYRVRDDNGIWGPEDLRDSDHSWWVNVGIVPATTNWVDGGCGDIQVACCTSDGECAEGLISDCLAANGVYYPISGDPEAPLHSCDDEGFECPVPAGDDCADAVPLCRNVCTHPTNNLLSTRWTCETTADCTAPDTCEPWAPDPDNGYCTNADLLDDGPVCSLSARDCYDNSPCRPYPDLAQVYRCYANKDNRLATTDGPPAAGGCFASGENSFQADIWHKITAPCTGILVIDECKSQLAYDGMLAVFGNHMAGYADTACPVTTNNDLIMCNDDFCPGSAVLSGVQADVVKDATYLLRTGGWAADGTEATASQGRATMNVGMICWPYEPPQSCPREPGDVIHRTLKNRFVSWDLSACGMVTIAYEVTLSEMNRCLGDDRRTCIVDDDCPGICTGDADLQCTSDEQCGPAGPCIPSGPCAPHPDVGTSWYIGEPYTKAAVPNDDLVGQWLANVVRDPIFRVWTEDVVHVTGCEIVPAAQYEWRAVNQEAETSDPLTKGTIVKPIGTHYGDVVGIVSGGAFTPPQGVVGVTDIQAYLIAFKGGAPGTIPPHTTWVDLHGTEWAEPCAGDNCTIPQAILNVSDLGRIKFGFIGQTYVETPGQENPGDCP